MPRFRGVARFAAIVLLASVAVLLFFSGEIEWHPRVLVANFAAAALFSVCIGGPLQVLLPLVAPRLNRRFRQPVYWVLMVGLMMAMASAGSAVAIAVLIQVGLVAPGQFIPFFLNALRISFAITITFGVGMSTYERMRKRADTAELALRTKERDEADARRAATEARLASLESRVQPHFLFNTLNSIAALIPVDPNGAERMTGLLASLLRASLDSADSPLVPLSTELQTVRTYLDIERVRFDDRLRYSIDVPTHLADVMVPRFALQTLVENSIKFAVAPRREGGQVRVSASAAADATTVDLVVEDDGPGFELATAPPRHGLALLRERLTLSFGERGALAVRATPGQTRVVVTVPR